MKQHSNCTCSLYWRTYINIYFPCSQINDQKMVNYKIQMFQVGDIIPQKKKKCFFPTSYSVLNSTNLECCHTSAFQTGGDGWMWLWFCFSHVYWTAQVKRFVYTSFVSLANQRQVTVMHICHLWHLATWLVLPESVVSYRLQRFTFK